MFILEVDAPQEIDADVLLVTVAVTEVGADAAVETVRYVWAEVVASFSIDVDQVSAMDEVR